ncbi:MAG: hypothetical protein ACK2T5_11460 [Anaerolineales bacterium]
MKRYFVWALVIFNSLIGFTRLIGSVIGLMGGSFSFTETVSFVIVIVAYSVLGAIIILRAEGNRVGWLMVLLGFVLADPFATYLAFNAVALQTQPSFFVYFAYWTQGWFYFVIIYTIFLIILHFPNGYPPSPRWNLINLISITTLGQFILVYTFQPKYGDSTLLIDNPIAVLSVSADDTLSGVLFGIGLILLALGSLISIFVRFRRAGSIERSQIKWLLFSGIVSFVSIGYRLETYEPGVSDWTGYLLTIALLSVAISISIAILRYRLYDIDLIIRRTLQYALVTGLLALVYFGSVVILQSLVENLTGEQSPLVIVLSTLAIAVLFNPLRTRVQDFIDRRFYRKKYDAEKALAQFAAAARDEVDMDKLSGALLNVVEETVQPDKVSMWMLRSEKE